MLATLLYFLSPRVLRQRRMNSLLPHNRLRRSNKWSDQLEADHKVREAVANKKAEEESETSEEEIQPVNPQTNINRRPLPQNQARLNPLPVNTVNVTWGETV